MKLGSGKIQKSRRQKGFSLIELMVAVSLVGVLSATAIPSMTKYIYDAKISEAAIILGDAGRDQERIHVMSGAYSDVLETTAAGKMAVSTRFPNSHFNLIVGGQSALQPGEKSRFDELNASLPTGLNSATFGSRGPTNYMIAVEGNVDGDSNVTLIAMNKRRTFVTVCDDYNNSDAGSFGAFWTDTTSLEGSSPIQPAYSCDFDVPPPYGYGGGPG